MSKGSLFDSRQGQEINLFCKVFRSILELTQPSVPCIPGVRAPEGKVAGTPSGAETENGYVNLCSLVYLYRLHRETFTFYAHNHERSLTANCLIRSKMPVWTWGQTLGLGTRRRRRLVGCHFVRRTCWHISLQLVGEWQSESMSTEAVLA